MDEKTTEEKIKEHVLLYADEALSKIQAGILEEFGEAKAFSGSPKSNKNI